MALYKPSNFYPNMNEVDLEDENGAEFECKIHANGDEVNAYKLNIYTEDGVQVYEQYKNLDEPLKDGEFLKCKVKYNKIYNNFMASLNHQEITYYQEYLSTGSNPQETTDNYTISTDYLKIYNSNFISFAITNTDLISTNYLYICGYAFYDKEKKLINVYDSSKHIDNTSFIYEFYNNNNNNNMYVKMYIRVQTACEDSSGNIISLYNYFKNQNTQIKIETNSFFATDNSNNVIYLYNYFSQKDVFDDYDFIQKKNTVLLKEMFDLNFSQYKIILHSGNGTTEHIIKNVEYKNDIFYLYFNENLGEDLWYLTIVLLNNYNYQWNIRLYNYQLNELNSLQYNYNNFIGNGELIGTKNNIVLYNMDNLYVNNKKDESIKEFIKQNNYIEIDFDEYNSNIFEEQQKYGKTTIGVFENFIINKILASDLNMKTLEARSTYTELPKKNEKPGTETWSFFTCLDTSKVFVPYIQSDNTYLGEYLDCSLVSREDTNSFIVKKTLNLKNSTIKETEKDITITIGAENYKWNEKYYDTIATIKINNFDFFLMNDNKIYFYCRFGRENGYSLDVRPYKVKFSFYDKQNKNFLYKKDVSVMGGNYSSFYIHNVEIPMQIKDPYVEIEVQIIVTRDNYNNLDTTTHINFGFFYYPYEQSNLNLKLQENSINITQYNLNNIFLQCDIYSNGNLEKPQKSFFENVVFYNSKNNQIKLKNEVVSNEILQMLQEKDSNNEFSYLIYYKILYHQREKILSGKQYIGDNNDIGLILLEDDFDFKLLNNNFFQIYECDCKYSNTTIYLPPINNEIVVGRYIRFPNIDGKSNSYSSNFQNVDTNDKKKYPRFKNVKETEFYITDSTKKFIYKIIGYDDETGEVRLESYNNNLGEKYIYSRYDQYEIWEEVEYSGDLQNDYFNRVYPSYINQDAKPDTLIGENIKQGICLSNTLNNIFLQNNINIKNDKFYMPQLKIDNKIYNLLLQTTIDEYNFEKDISLNNINNQQIQVNIDKELLDYDKQYKIYSAFVDSSPESYFYAKGKSKITLKYGEYNYYLNNVKGQGHTIYDDWYNRIEDLSAQTTEIKDVYDKDVIFVAKFEKDIEIKKYKYELYSSETGELLKEIDYIYGDDMHFYVRGLINNERYTLILYVETEYNGEYKEVYNLLVQTTENESPNPFPNIVSNNSISSLCGNEIILNYDLDPMDKIIYVNDGYSKLDTLIYYKYIPEINFSKKKYALLCYNLRNNYNYQLKIYNSFNSQMPTHLTYHYTISQFKTCMNSYTLMDIVKIDDETYESGDRWSFKYNLDAGDTTINNSIAKADTIGQYQRLSIGKRKYESGTISCLIGDVDDCNYTEFDGNNNINKLLKCKEFISNGNLKLLKDYKGNKFIVNTAENLSYKIDTNSHGQNTTISFTWVEVMSSDNISIRDFIELTE